MTSPAAKMCGCAVRYSASTAIRPRASASQPGRGEVQPVGRALAAGGVEHDVGRKLLAALELGDDAAVREPLDRVHLFAEAEDEADPAQVVLQCLDELVVDEVEEARALLDDRHVDAERRAIDAYSRPITPPPTTVSVRGSSAQAEDPVGVDARFGRRSRRPAGVRAWCRRR